MTKSVKDAREQGKSHLDSVTDYLMSKDGSATFPRNSLFKKNFIELDIYNRGKQLARYTLYSLEEHQQKEIVEYDNLSAEHIMPQKLTPKWNIDLGKNGDQTHKLYKDTIGNLTITKNNSELSNKSFDEKKEIYFSSNIKLTREIVNYENWDETSITDRANKLYSLAEEIWELPTDRYTDILHETLQPGSEYLITDNINVTGTKPATLIIDSETYSVNSWRSLLIQVCYFLIDYDRALFRSLLNNSNFTRLIFKHSEGIRRVEQLEEHLFIETNFSAKDILNYTRLLTKEYSLEEFVSFMISF